MRPIYHRAHCATALRLAQLPIASTGILSAAVSSQRAADGAARATLMTNAAFYERASAAAAERKSHQTIGVK